MKKIIIGCDESGVFIIRKRTLFLLLFALLFVGVQSCRKESKAGGILQSVTDARGLRSVAYVEGGDTFALDYLTAAEYRGRFGSE